MYNRKKTIGLPAAQSSQVVKGMSDKMIQKMTDPASAAPLFSGWPETMVWSCLQGVMGGVYAKKQEKPASAMALLGDFCFLAGKPDEELAAFKPAECDRNFMILVPRTADWEPVIFQCYEGRATAVERYAFKKEPEIFQTPLYKERLQQAAAGLPAGFEIRLIDEALYRWCRTQRWCGDWVAQYPDYESYRKLGIGFAVLCGDEVVAGASSYTTYRGGIEIQIDTKEAYRRKGLAYACAARLILACVERGLYPSWDAQNLQSVGLAKKLGYHFDHAYKAYEIENY